MSRRDIAELVSGVVLLVMLVLGTCWAMNILDAELIARGY